MFSSDFHVTLRIMDYSYRKNLLYFEIDPILNDRVTAILVF